MCPFSLITSMSFVLEPNGPATRRGMQYARNKERKGGSFPYCGIEASQDKHHSCPIKYKIEQKPILQKYHRI